MSVNQDKDTDNIISKKAKNLYRDRTRPNHFVVNGIPFSDLKHNPYTHVSKEDDPYFYKFNIERYFNVDQLLNIPSNSFLGRFLSVGSAKINPDTYSLLSFHNNECSNCSVASLLDFYMNDFILGGFIYRSINIKNSIMMEAEFQQKNRKQEKCTLKIQDFCQYHENELIHKNAPIDVYELALFLRKKYINVLLVQENNERPEENHTEIIATRDINDLKNMPPGFYGYAVLYINRSISNNVMILTKRSPDKRVKLLFSFEDFFDEIMHEENICSVKHSFEADVNPIKKIEKKLKTLYEMHTMPDRLVRQRKKRDK
tara:strand:+ start:3235 stop:4179 length:945 start_codon:yes stop_codon:yes gene_type:complete